MLGMLKRSRRVEEQPRDAQEVEVLDVERRYYLRPGQEVAESMRLLYTVAGRPRQTTVWLTWHALAQLRQVLAAAGRTIEDDELLEVVALQWGSERLRETYARGEEAPIEGYVLSFPAVPRPAGPRALLERCGLV